MRKMSGIWIFINVLIWIILLAGLVGGLTYTVFNATTSKEVPVFSPDVKNSLVDYFKDKTDKRIIAGQGRPIEGVEPGHLDMAYEGLSHEDFQGVEAAQGFYIVKNDEIIFRQLLSNGVAISSGRAISDKGYETFLINIGVRLDHEVESRKDVDQLLDRIS
jgi:hypothetical protein